MLDKYQRDIVNSKEKNLLVVASPGSGKTTVIINRTGFLIKDQGIDPSSLAIITFTKAAAQNMKTRFRALYPETKEPFFGTFHSLFYDILKKHRGRLNIINSFESHSIVERTLKRYIGEISEERVQDVLNYISAYKTGFKTLDQLTEFINIKVLKECFESYENYKNIKGLLDFDDLQTGVFELFNKHKEVIEVYRSKIKFLLVDEFQDCDKMQIDILKKLCLGNSLFAVGDEDQCIYGFRGARPDYMVNFKENFQDGVKKFLTNNYRSVRNIVELSGNLIEHNITRNIKKFSAIKTDLGEIICERFQDERKQSLGISERIIKDVLSCKGKYGDNAVLYRTNIESRAVIDAFIKNKIPFYLLDKAYNFYNHFICKDLVGYICLSKDLTSRSDFKRIINKPFRYISKINLEKLTEYKIKDDCFDILCDIPTLPFFQYKELKTLRKNILKISKLDMLDITEYILYKLDYYKYLEEYCRKHSIEKADLEDIVEEFKQSLNNFDTIEDFLEHIKNVEEELSKDSHEGRDVVLLSTIHGVKGMEFKNVFIVNCVNGKLPYCRGERTNDIEEERRLFYVGITRAQCNLYLSIPLCMKGTSKEDSPFIEECKITNFIDSTNEYNIGTMVRHNSFGEGTVVSIGKGEIGIKFKDNILRYFNIHKLVGHNLLKKMA